MHNFITMIVTTIAFRDRDNATDLSAPPFF